MDYYHAGDKPYLISGADDRLVKIWDYQNKTCVQTLEGHAQNISSVAFHPELPILLTGSEDGTVRCLLSFFLLIHLLFFKFSNVLMHLEYGIQIPIVWRLHSIMVWSACGPFAVYLVPITSPWVTMKDLS